MANLFLTGSGAPTSGIGEATDYYRDTVTNLIYYKDSPTNWVGVPSLTPTPDGVGTTWHFGSGAPEGGIGSTNDYYRDDTNGSVYRKHATNGWEALGSLDFIGVYGVQWGEGTGAPANTEPLNNLPAGSFYLDVATSNIYYKDTTLTWSLKGQLGGGSGGGSVTVVDDLNSTSDTDALSANQGNVLDGRLQAVENDKADIDSPALITPTATTHPDTNDSSLLLSTTQMVQGVAAAAEAAAVATASADATSKANTAEANAKTYADNLVVGLLDDCGNYDPTITSAYPTSANGGSGAAGAVLKGDLWTISANGTMGGIAVTIGDTVRALVNSPGQTASNWAITENNIGYVPENSTNKSTATDLGGGSPSDTLYPTQAAVKGYVDTNALTAATARYTFNPQTGTSYTVQASDITANGRVIVKCTNAAAIAVTIATPTSLLGGVAADHVGKSVNIRQGGAGAITISGPIEGNGVFTAQHETKTLIAQDTNDWLVVGG